MFLAVFTEVQKFSAWPLLLLLAVVALILIRAFFTIVATRESKRVYWLLPLFLIPVAVLVLTLLMYLNTRIDGSGIYYRFYPVHSQDHKIEWEDVDSVYVRMYSPVSEYGGWGIRNGHNGKAYNTSGDWGLQLVFKNGTRILLGTQEPDKVKIAINEFAPPSVKR